MGEKGIENGDKKENKAPETCEELEVNISCYEGHRYTFEIHQYT